eukprot:Skav213630  [mRNA]  locus=scaffold4520:170090:171369:- [translate_table: standard]
MAPCHWLAICSAMSLQTAAEVFGTVKVEGYVPKARMLSSMVLYKKRLWSFGGVFPGDASNQFKAEVLGDLNCFDIDSKTWTKVSADGAPKGRAGHGAVVDFAGTMWLWGGAMGEGGTYGRGSQKVYSINLNELDLHPKDGHYGAWQKVDIFMDMSPSPRWQHSTVMNGTGMVIAGGEDDLNHDLYGFDNLQYLDFEKKEWSELKCQGDVPSARAGHGAAMTSLGQMWIYGGHGQDGTTLEDLYYLKLDKGIWVKVAAKGVSPGPLFYHVQVIDAAGRMWLASGGKPGHDMHPGLYPFDLTQNDKTNGRMYCYGGVVEKDGERFPDALATIAWMDTNQPTPSTATTSAHPLDPASEGGIGAGTILVILLVVAAIVAGGLFFLRRRREMRLLQEVQEPREVELGA